jgi:hypothetical protein
MEMEFTVQPAGVGNVKIGNRFAVIFDISRQRESTEWDYDNGSWNNTGDPITNGAWPTLDEMPNDDYGNLGDNDEDDTPKNDHIYSYDFPGYNNVADVDRAVLRYNFYEFVRVRFDGQDFPAGHSVEGSRASGKAAWRSRMDVVDDGTGKWQRNNNQPPGEVENEIMENHKPLTQNQVWP